MYREIPKLVLYRDLGEGSILKELAAIIQDNASGNGNTEEIISRIYQQIKRLLDLATSYGFDKNLWQDYLAYILITNENSFTLTCEKVGAGDGSVNGFAKNDYEIFMKLFHYDFTGLERELGIDCFSTITNYKSLHKTEHIYNKLVS